MKVVSLIDQPSRDKKHAAGLQKGNDSKGELSFHVFLSNFRLIISFPSLKEPEVEEGKGRPGVPENGLIAVSSFFHRAAINLPKFLSFRRTDRESQRKS